MMPEWFYEMTFSDWTMVTFGVLTLVFLVDYMAGSPFWQHPIGYIVVLYSFSVLLLVFLIVYGMVAGQRVEEWARTLVTGLLVVSISGKLIILHRERKIGAQMVEEDRILEEKIAELEVELARERSLNSRRIHPID